MMGVKDDWPGFYKWVVVLASFMLQYLASSVAYCIGVFYVMFRQNLGGSSSVISLASSFNTAILFGVGPLAGAIVNRYGCRVVAMAGSLIGAIGLILTAFVTQPWHLIITFGVISGFGMGLSYIPAITVVGIYFGKRRSLAMGIAVTGLGAGPITAPPMIRLLEEHFGWRGAILIVSGLYLHSVIFSALLRPIPATTIRETEDLETQSALVVVRNTPVSPPLIVKDQPSVLSSFIGHYRPIFTNTPLSLFFVQNVLFSFGISVINVHVGAFAISRGYNADQAAMLYFSMGVSSAISRVFYGGLMQVPVLKPTVVFAVTTSLCGVCTAVYPLGLSYTALVAISSAVGVFYASYGSLPPLITIELAGVERLADAYGYICVGDGIGLLIGGATAGWLYDATKNYIACLFLACGSMVSSSIVMVIIYLLQCQVTQQQHPDVLPADNQAIEQPDTPKHRC